MANVNLISARRAERVRFTRLAKGLSLTCLAAGAAVLLGVGFVGSQIVLTRNAIGEVDRELEKLRPIREQIERDERERMALQPKIETLTKAQAGTRRWSGMMEGLKRAVPDQTWLTNISVEQAGAASKVMKINGITETQARVGETMLRLSGQPEYYQRVDLGFTTASKQAGRERQVEFELKAPLAELQFTSGLSPAGDGDAIKAN
jgi:Tfp pilus assembly protein PilN